MLTIGERYSRREVHLEVGGGDPRSYLLTREKRVLAACLDPQKNPESPRIILVGAGKNVIRAGGWLSQQKGSIAVFTKDPRNMRDDAGDARNWLYWGRFAVERASTERADIARHNSIGRDVTRVIELRPTTDDLWQPIDDATDDIGTDFPARTVTSGVRYARDPRVRAAVLKRARGRCELCGEEGFKTLDGRAYLECHHIIALADDGADKMSNVIALCPRHHREAHYGAHGEDLERAMKESMALLNSARIKRPEISASPPQIR